MHNAISPFNFESHSVRIQLDDAQQPWFCANDVCSALGFGNPHQAVGAHVQKQDLCKTEALAGRSRQLMNFINESGLYSLILGSHKPAAKRFKRWVTAEVLPQIRKTGSYQAQEATSRTSAALPDFSNPAAAARAWAEQFEARQLAEAKRHEIGSRREATAMATASVALRKVKQLEKALGQSKLYATIKRMQALFPGKKFSWHLLKKTAESARIPSLDVFDANYGSVKAYHAMVWFDAYGLEIYPGAFDDAFIDLDRVYGNTQS